MNSQELIFIMTGMIVVVAWVCILVL